MFTGLVQDVGIIEKVDSNAGGARLTIETKLASEINEGDSVAISGVCLTATSVSAKGFAADAINETLSRTSIGLLEVGGEVNLELAMKADGRFGGHIVQGHVDGVGTIAATRVDGVSEVITIETAPELLRYIVEKGSITIDGISLTVAGVDAKSFSVALIPETLARTTLGSAAEADTVNLETDIFAKYAEKLAR